MVKQLNTAQKRGMLIVLGTLVILAGWRWRAAHAAGIANGSVVDSAAPSDRSSDHKVELNAADTTVLQTVKGIGAASARRIVRYRGLIGGYTSTDQLLKVWGITPENFVRIEEQVYVDTTTAAFAALRRSKPSNKGDYRPRFSQRPRYAANPQGTCPAQAATAATSAMANSQQANESAQTIAQIATAPAPARNAKRQTDLNTADSLDLVSISGIGASTARNILKYRALIYFYESLDQLAEVWGIRPENLERMTPYLTVGPSRHAMPHLKVNEMTVDEMGRHKYLGWKDAKIIVAYRELHGKFADFAALGKVQAIEPTKLEKLKPYLEF